MYLLFSCQPQPAFAVERSERPLEASSRSRFDQNSTSSCARLICATGTRWRFAAFFEDRPSPSSTPAIRPGERRLAVRSARSSRPSPAAPRTAGSPLRAAAADRAPATTLQGCNSAPAPPALELVFFDVEQRAQVVADALAVLDADRLLERLGHAAVRPVDDDAQHRADRLAPQLDVENLEPVTPRATRSRGRSADAVPLFSCAA